LGELKDAVTRCILRPVDASNCVCGRGSALGPAGGAYRAPSDSLKVKVKAVDLYSALSCTPKAGGQATSNALSSLTGAAGHTGHCGSVTFGRRRLGAAVWALTVWATGHLGAGINGRRRFGAGRFGARR